MTGLQRSRLFLGALLVAALVTASVFPALAASQSRVAVPEYFYGTKSGWEELKANIVRAPSPPRRVVVLWPYTAEILKALGAEKAVVGVCESVKEKNWPPT